MSRQPEHDNPSDNTTPDPTLADPNKQPTGDRESGSPLAVVGLLGVICLALVIGVVWYTSQPDRNGMAASSPENAEVPRNLGDPFKQWGKPDFVLVLSGQVHGYLQPCGCSKPQFGGYARRFEFIQSLRKRGWVVVPVDLGDIADKSGPQTLLKYETAMKALNAMNYTAVSLGEREFRLPLIEGLSHYSLEHKTPALVAANLMNRGENEVFEPFQIRPFIVATGQGLPRIGIMGFIGHDVIQAINKINDPDVQFAKSNIKVIGDTLNQMRARKSDFNVILYQGSKESDDGVTALAKYCEKNHADTPIHVILRLNESSEPSGIPLKVGKTTVVGVGHKGRFVGVVGVFRKGNSFTTKYELVSMAPKYETPDGKEDTNPVIALMEDYAKKVKAGNYIHKFPRHKHWLQNELKDVKVTYAGTKACAGCHTHAHKVWENSAHSHAWQTLKDATRPSLRDFDGECVACHSVGFKYESGYLDPDNSKRRNMRLLNVGCESCHGPASYHANDPFNKAYYELVNPWRMSVEERNPKTAQTRKDFLKKQRMLKVDIFCQSCHDIENDVNWANVPFEKKWGPVEHATPKGERVGVQAAP